MLRKEEHEGHGSSNYAGCVGHTAIKFFQPSTCRVSWCCSVEREGGFAATLDDVVKTLGDDYVVPDYVPLQHLGVPAIPPSVSRNKFNSRTNRLTPIKRTASIAIVCEATPPPVEHWAPPIAGIDTSHFSSWLHGASQEIKDLSLDEVAANLATDSAEFHSICMMLSKLAPGSAQDVSKYLYDNSVLLTASQAKRIFDICYPKLSAKSNAPEFTDHRRYSVRSQLVMVLHRFCVQPYVCWEDDGDHRCMWASMTYNGVNLWDTSLCEDLDGNPVGELKTWEPPEGSDRGTVAWSARQTLCLAGCGFYPGNDGYCSLCRVGKGPKYPGGKCPNSVEEARSFLRQDVCHLRGALAALRSHNDRAHAMQTIVEPHFYGESLTSLMKVQKKMFYLPVKMQGSIILRRQHGNNFVADDSMLKSGKTGIWFRRSKNVEDKVRGLVMPFGSSIVGSDDGDDWVCIEDVQASMFEAQNEAAIKRELLRA